MAHIAFTCDGKYALVSIWEDDGAVIVYDAKTLAELRRGAMRKRSGKYNVWNKFTVADGTSDGPRPSHCRPWQPVRA
ncbi:cytochrome D1 domain-containing protein [Thioclava arctica]|uniref:cytochrome D1 domain-containing protein n=1 Tax=Thioclava arctica TaxID=3238301 RepID=UPI003F62A464